jgi:energy-converting hydrogenase B subunit D
MLSVIGFVLMKAPDVAVTEAVIGSGLVTSLFVFTLLSVKKVGAKA